MQLTSKNIEMPSTSKIGVTLDIATTYDSSPPLNLGNKFIFFPKPAGPFRPVVLTTLPHGGPMYHISLIYDFKGIPNVAFQKISLI